MSNRLIAGSIANATKGIDTTQSSVRNVFNRLRSLTPREEANVRSTHSVRVEAYGVTAMSCIDNNRFLLPYNSYTKSTYCPP